MVEINAETDFVARNGDFQAVVREVATLALDCDGDIERLSAASYPGTGRTVAEEITNLVATIGENIQLRRTAVFDMPAGAVGDYLHMPATPGLRNLWASSTAITRFGGGLPLPASDASTRSTYFSWMRRVSRFATRM